MIKLDSEEILFENFIPKNKWEFISDQVMGGVSFGNYQIISDGEQNFLRLRGFVSLDNNGGFIQVRKNLTKFEHNNIKGIKIKSRGNNTHYFIHIRTKFTLLPWQYYQGKFFASNGWKNEKIDLTNFKASGNLLPKRINPKHIKSIAIVAFGREHEVNLEVSEIRFY